MSATHPIYQGACVGGVVCFVFTVETRSLLVPVLKPALHPEKPPKKYEINFWVLFFRCYVSALFSYIV